MWRRAHPEVLRADSQFCIWGVTLGSNIKQSTRNKVKLHFYTGTPHFRYLTLLHFADSASFVLTYFIDWNYVIYNTVISGLVCTLLQYPIHYQGNHLHSPGASTVLLLTLKSTTNSNVWTCSSIVLCLALCLYLTVYL